MLKNNWSVYFYENGIKKHEFCTYERKEELINQFDNNIISVLNCSPIKIKHDKW